MQSAIYSDILIGLQLWPMELAWHVGDIVRKLRLAGNMSQRALGKKAGKIDKGTISRLENGEIVNTDTLERVAGALGLDVGDLYALVPKRKDQLGDESSAAKPKETRTLSTPHGAEFQRARKR